VPATFRVVDQYSYWQIGAAIDRVTVADVIELAPIGGLGDADVLPRIPPRWLARGCGACTWWLIAPCAPHLLRSIGETWCPVGDCALGAVCPSAVASSGDLVAVLDPGRGDVRVLTGDGRRVVVEIVTAARGPIALDRRGTLYVVDGTRIARFDRSGVEQPAWSCPDDVDRIAIATDHSVWLVTSTASGLALYRRSGDAFVPATVTELDAAFPITDLIAADANGFCLQLPAGPAAPVTICFDRCGRPGPAIPPPPPTPRAKQGSICFALLDSGIQRCVWHRVVVEADVPDRTAIEIKLATLEDPHALLHPDDWQDATIGATDSLIDQPPGRYLKLVVILHGDGVATPTVNRLRVELPRSTSAEWLPAVYREDPASRDFVERFMALFDASLGDLDRVITRFPALLDPGSIPNDVLAWLGSVVGIALDPSTAPDRRRALIAAAPELFRTRGTPAGLARVLELAFGVTPAIEELGLVDPFGRIGGARVGETRLFGAGRVRARLGSSKLGSTTIRAFGDPDQDARALLAYRVRVQMPGTGDLATPLAQQRVERVVAANKPAHVVADVRIGGGVAVLGPALALGIDTALVGLAPTRLGETARLRRQTVLWPGRARAGAVLSIGRAAVIGAHTILR
jgi:phage tail-like protein